MPRPRISPIGNAALAAAIHQTGRSYGSIAETINRVSRESGIAVHCSAASLGKWINGATPIPTTAAAAVEAFSRLLDRPNLTAGDLGWADPQMHPPQDPWRGDP